MAKLISLQVLPESMFLVTIETFSLFRLRKVENQYIVRISSKTGRLIYDHDSEFVDSDMNNQITVELAKQYIEKTRRLISYKTRSKQSTMLE